MKRQTSRLLLFLLALAPFVAQAKESRLATTGDKRRDEQIAAVAQSFDSTGRPPEGVHQGGRRGKQRGVFQNAEGRLPKQPKGYYKESDVWPKSGSSRGPERLIFGKKGEIWFSPDHYRTFQRLR